MLPNPDYARRPPFEEALRQVSDADRAAAWTAFAEAFEDARRSWAVAPKPDLAATRPGAIGAKLAEFQQNGFAVFRIDPRRKAEIVRLAEPALDMVRESMASATGKVKFADGAAWLDPKDNRALYALVAEALEDCGALPVANIYSRATLAFDLYAQINTAERTTGKWGPIDKDGLPREKSAYWHVDSNIYPPAKMLIYLNEVGRKQGPFRYIAGSHLAMDEREALIRKTNDKLRFQPIQFMALPEEFRLHALFGDHLDRDSDAVRSLLAKERAVFSEDGDVSLFDNHGVHRGGFVRDGVREILQVLLEPVRASKPKEHAPKAEAVEA